MRLSRPCYDKPHRCPGWAGGGPKSAKTDRCEGGSIRTRVPEDPFEGMENYPPQFKYPGVVWWRFGHCNTCDVVTWPWAARRLDPTYWKSRIGSAARRLRWKIEDAMRERQTH